MKRIRMFLITGLATFALAMAPTILVTSVQASPVPVLEDEEATELLLGIVKEKEDDELVLTDQVDKEKETKVRLSDDTTYVKDGQPATAEDLNVGDRVRVKATKSFLGRYDAVEVTILPTLEEPTPEF